MVNLAANEMRLLARARNVNEFENMSRQQLSNIITTLSAPA